MAAGSPNGACPAVDVTREGRSSGAGSIAEGLTYYRERRLSFLTVHELEQPQCGSA